MEQSHSQELFSLQIDPLTKSHLWETARWAKFLSIVGFVLCGLILIGGLFFSTFLVQLLVLVTGVLFSPLFISFPVFFCIALPIR